MTLNCFKCKAEVVFDNEHIGKNGRKIPLDPETHQPHDCPMRDKPTVGESGSERVDIQAKNDHGNEIVESPKEMYQRIASNTSGDLIKGYVDHTQGPKLKLKVLTSTEAEGLALVYNNFGETHNIKFSQYQIAGSLYTIAVWYSEEIKQ